MVYKDKEITHGSYGFCDYDDDHSIILCIRNLGCHNAEDFNPLGKTLPVALSKHDEMLKNFCKKNKIKPKAKPQWFLLGYYG
jgi:hypothetical protein